MGALSKKCRLVEWGPLYFNPVVSFISFFVLWGITIYCMVEPDDAKKVFSDGEKAAVATMSWFYMSSQNIWLIFGIYIYYQYGNVKLCAKGDEDKGPEYDNFSYFVMIYTCGVAVGMFVYGVAEPFWHYNDGLRTGKLHGGTMTDVEKAQWALTQTNFHWGIHGWVPYMLLAVTIGVVAYKKGLPLTIRTCFWPILGNGIYGWIGDLIDSLSIITVVIGICTSLALGTDNILVGLKRLDSDIYNPLDEDSRNGARATIICLITLVATVSVVSGLNYGIKIISRLGFVLGMILLLMVFFLDDSWAFLNVFCQSIGHYFQYIIELGWWTDAWAEMGKESSAKGDAWEGNKYSGPPDGQAKSAMAGWTTFYWAWWITWAPFVGTFIARISYGRTIRDVINYSMIAPLFYIMLWFSVFGTAGIKMFWTSKNLQNVVPAVQSFQDSASGATCYNYPAATNFNAGIDTKYRVACDISSASGDHMLYLTLGQYYGLETFLTVICVGALIAYFIASSDSGSLVVDLLAANGKIDASSTQRVLWAVTEGAVAIALMTAGGPTGARAIRSLAMACGVPFNALLCFMCVCLYRVLAEETETIGSSATFTFQIWEGVFDTMEWIFSFGTHPFPGLDKWVGFLKGIFAPFVAMNAAQVRIGSSDLFRFMYCGMGIVCFYTFAFSLIYGHAKEDSGLWAIGWTFYTFFAFIMAETRYRTRAFYGIKNSNFLEDFACFFFLWPQAAAQLEALAETSPKAKADYIVKDDVQATLEGIDLPPYKQ